MPSISWPPEPARDPDAIRFGGELFSALRERRTLAPLSGLGLGLGVDEAYAISLEFLRRRLADGERIVGKKIGVTSKVVQDMLGVRQPDFGFLTDAMVVAPDGVIDIAGRGLIQPRAEAEIAFVLKKDLKGPGVAEADVLDATEAIAPCFEVVDSRIDDWKIGIVDTVADNASCGVFVIGEARVDPRGLDLAGLHVRVTKNGQFLSEGYGSAVQGSPLTAVAWLANTLGAYGVPFKAGEVVLSGSLVPLAPAAPGDVFEMDLKGVGACRAVFS
jgi:2-oxopent-4-enoate/cis-2-oxohex-4-enoate hydratase